MANVAIIFLYFDKREKVAPEIVRSLQDLPSLEVEVERLLNLPAGTYDFADQHATMHTPQDLKRAIGSATGGECKIEIREHRQFTKLRDLENQLNLQAAKLIRAEAETRASEERSSLKTEATKKEIMGIISKLHQWKDQVVMPSLEAARKDIVQLQKESRTIMEKLSGIDVEELRRISEQSAVLHEQVKSAVKRVDKIDASWAHDKGMMMDDISKNEQDLRELQRYMQGKVDVCIDADADLRHQQQLLNERGQIVADDVRLLQEDLRHLAQRCSGALEESEELRTLLGQVREDNTHLNSSFGEVRTRVNCIEGAATEKWEGFSPGVLYFRKWNNIVKGSDVQFSSDLSKATGRGFLAATGVVIGNEEGLVVADGPTRRFGTPGTFSSYYEVEIDEIAAAPSGAGGLYVGFTIQAGEEILGHPKKEFDGWLIGGHGKALICRRGTVVSDDDLGDIERIPLTFAVAGVEHVSMEAVKLLRCALPPKPKGDTREVESMWNSEALRMGDRIGVVFRAHRDGGARLRIAVNGVTVANHEFIDAPPAEAIGFLHPIIRLAGTGKSCKILPGLQPPSRLLAD